ncbi:PxKF domain-containing protein [Methyloglobulus sp.]|uniref:PxKF domain-containing protein n=1 Tax=Methyloglobulus sp. TaxID=2518622 RepID=UPI003989AE24
MDLRVNRSGLRFRTNPDNVNFSLLVVNDHYNGYDSYSVFSAPNLLEVPPPQSSSYPIGTIGFQLSDSTMNALSSDALPTTPPFLDDWQQPLYLLIEASYSPFESFYAIQANITSAVLSDGGGTDANGDGVEDAIETAPGSFADTRTPPTTGSIVDAGSLGVTVADSTDPAQGVVIRAGPGSGQASLLVCGFPVLLSPDSTTVITCGSIEVNVSQGGLVVVQLNDTVTVNLGTGAIAKITQVENGPFYVENNGDNQAVTVTQNGNTTIVNPGPPYVVGHLVTGYFQPVDMNGIFNVVKAGSAVPLKWRITEVPAGTPVTDLASVKLKVQDVNCNLGFTTDQLEEVASGGSGLKNLGGGNYQFNWKTPKSYANSCKKLLLDLGGGLLAPPALFSFK